MAIINHQDGHGFSTILPPPSASTNSPDGEVLGEGIESKASEGTDVFYSPFQRSTNTTESPNYKSERIVIAGVDVTGMNRNSGYKLGSPEQRRANAIHPVTQAPPHNQFGINLMAT